MSKTPQFDKALEEYFTRLEPELDFYRKHDLPLPIYHPSERMAQRRKNFGPIILEFYKRPCVKCGIIIESVYSLDREEKNIYCDKCYLDGLI